MHKSSAVMLLSVLLASCSAVYPSGDFSEAPCGPPMQHWTLPKPCGVEVLRCIGECRASDSACEDICYSRNPGCGLCVINEAVLCVREWGCEPEYEDLTCCADDNSCGYDDDACLGMRCDIEVINSNACQGAIGSDCDQAIIDGCFR